MASLLHQLIIRGDIIAIEHGQLKISPVSGCPIPSDWLKKHHDTLVMQILSATECRALKYIGHTVKDYKSEGYVTLQFETCLHHLEWYAIFNCLRSRQRDTRYGAKGSKLPRGHFSVQPRSDLAKLVKALPFKTPKLSSFHEHMGNLKGLLFVGQTDRPDSEKLNKKTLALLNISAATIREAVIRQTSTTDTGLTNHRQVTDSSPTSPPTSKPDQPSNYGAFSQSQPHNNNHRNTVNRDAVKQPNILSFPSPSSAHLLEDRAGTSSDQTTDEWLSDYEAGPDWNHGNFPNDFG